MFRTLIRNLWVLGVYLFVYLIFLVNEKSFRSFAGGRAGNEKKKKREGKEIADSCAVGLMQDSCSLTWHEEWAHWAHGKATHGWTVVVLARKGRLLAWCFPRSSCTQAGCSKHQETSGKNKGVGEAAPLCAHAEHWLQCPQDLGEWGE